MATIRISAFRWVPPFAQGLVRDLRVRWALEEAGLEYEENLIGPEDQDTGEYRRLQPFGQVPCYEENGLKMFESGAIVLHIVGKTGMLLPVDANQRARMMTWAFAALNTIEPVVANLAHIDLFYPTETWAQLRRPGAEAAVRLRLKELAEHMNGRKYLEAGFTAGDLLMTTVLRGLRQTDILQDFPLLEAYRKRCESRPAFQKALAAQMSNFEQYVPVEA